MAHKHNVLKPTVGTQFFQNATLFNKNSAKPKSFESRWKNHYHFLYGINLAQVCEESLFDHPITNLLHTPYWDITSNEKFREKGALELKPWYGDTGVLGLLDYLNPTQPLSILFIALATKLHRAANHRLREWVKAETYEGGYDEEANEDYNRLTGSLIKMAALTVDVLLRLPFGIAATATTHVFDIAKRLAAMVIATITAILAEGAETLYNLLPHRSYQHV